MEYGNGSNLLSLILGRCASSKAMVFCAIFLNVFLLASQYPLYTASEHAFSWLRCSLLD